jgi:hypothetical protein
MPPLGPIRRDDGPACRVCGCTEHNACVTATGAGAIACHWAVKTAPRLCSACAGTVDDALHTIRHVHRLMKSGRVDHARRVAEDFIDRYQERQKTG